MPCALVFLVLYHSILGMVDGYWHAPRHDPRYAAAARRRPSLRSPASPPTGPPQQLSAPVCLATVDGFFSAATTHPPRAFSLYRVARGLGNLLAGPLDGFLVGGVGRGPSRSQHLRSS